MKKLGFLLLAITIVISSLALTVSAYDTPFSVAPKGEVPEKANTPANVNFSLREGGKYIYCNNPERIFKEDLGKALMIEHDLKGDVFFTNENICAIDKGCYLGLQLRNNTGEDISVTVKNLGYQVGGDWVGQQEWTDFFQTTFEIQQGVGGSYGFSKVMTPKSFTATTYVIPSGKYIYLMGGTTLDAYNNINVGGTANKYITSGQCTNGVVFFTVNTEKDGVDAAFVCYNSPSSPVTTDKQQGYLVSRNGESFGRQYLGSAPYLCVDANMAWNIDDNFKDGDRLPVTYKTTYYGNYASFGEYEAYTNPKTKTNTGNVWKTNLNPESDNTFVGKDMMPFYCVTEKDGKAVIVDIAHNDGTEYKKGNFGNWMTVYEETMTFKNSGTKARSFDFSMDIKGVAAVNIRDKNGELLRSIYHAKSGEAFYTLTVMAGATETITVEYVLLANSYGNVTHYVTAGTPKLTAKLGDVDGNGKIEAKDYMLLKRYCLKTTSLDGDALLASDINSDGKVDAKDYGLLKRHCLKTYTIVQPE